MAENKIISQIAPVYLQSLLTYEQDFLIFNSKEADYDIQTTYAFHHYIVVTLLEQGEIDVTLNGIAHHILQAPGIHMKKLKGAKKCAFYLHSQKKYTTFAPHSVKGSR